MTRPAQFDVFLCHNSEDKPFIRDIARQLRAQNLTPWLDEEQLIPGRDWLDILEQDIERIKTVAVFVGKAGVGPWQRREISAFLREFVELGTPVIPVLLPNAPAQPKLPILLKNMTYVDFRKQETDPFEYLLWGITGARVRSKRPEPSISLKKERNKVFISYSHEDKQWLKRLQTMLKPLIRSQIIDLWDDTQIPVGKNWLEAITSALEAAKVAVLLVSPDFLASDFIANEELPIFLNAERKGGLKIVVIHISPSLYDHTEISHYQAANDPERPLDSLDAAEVNRVLRDICKEIVS